MITDGWSPESNRFDRVIKSPASKSISRAPSLQRAAIKRAADGGAQRDDVRYVAGQPLLQKKWGRIHLLGLWKNTHAFTFFGLKLGT